MNSALLTLNFSSLLAAGLVLTAVFSVRADQEQDLIAVLQSSADVPAKSDACKQLRIIGTAKAIPALAALLDQDRLAHAARYALEGLPCPEAVDALREALGKTSGLNKAGVIDSLGWRRDPRAVPALGRLLTDADGAIASAAATALGRIGGRESAVALTSALDHTLTSDLRPLTSDLLDALLGCADLLRAEGNAKEAGKLYARLDNPKSPQPIRLAAWRGVVLTDKSGRAKRLLTAMGGSDLALRRSAIQVLRELGDPQVIRASLNRWSALPPEAQAAVLDCAVELHQDTDRAIQLAAQSPEASVRQAAWEAVAKANATSQIPGLAKAAASGSAEEQQVARETLGRLRGPGARSAILKNLDQAEPPARAELLRSLGARSDRASVPVLLEHLKSPEPVRGAALDALRQIAAPETAVPLLNLAAKAESGGEDLLSAVAAVCQASGERTQTSTAILAAMQGYTETERGRVLPVLAELGTPAALDTALAAARSPNIELRKTALRTLAEWPTAAPAPELIALAKSNPDDVLRILAVRGAIKVAAHEPDPGRQLSLLKEAVVSAGRAEDKRAALGQMGQLPTAEALAAVTPYLDDPDLVNEAGQAAVSIAEKLAPANPKLAEEAAAQVLAKCKAVPVVKRAWDLRGAQVGSSPFIQDWLVCGPYTQPGVVGAVALFPIAFGPEKGEAVTWKSLPRGDHANLTALFPGIDNSVAYLKAQFTAPAPGDAMLLIGSDDGVKAWLNGEVVHSQNVDRGAIPDQDKVPIRLKAGANELMLKITQGGGGWMACARIVGADGQPVPGLRVEPQTAPQAKATTPKPEPPVVAVPSVLPARDSYRKLRLSDQFYAEGAYFADFNRDQKLDVVAGPFWFEGPDFQKRHEYRPVKTFEAAKEYSDNFLTYAGDMNGDDWPDVLFVPFPGKEAYWYENPAGKEGHWKQHLAYTNVGNESPMWGDVIGAGRPQLLFCNEGFLGYAAPDFTHPEQPWTFHPISNEDRRYQRFTHGVGFGDINGDRRNDVVEAAGWWEQPAERKDGQPWIWHPFHFADAGAQMYVYDVNGDGLADIITAWHCHLYGLVWWQQVRAADGQIDWRQHTILPPAPNLASSDFRVSQLHAMVLADMNGDGALDILTGKRFWSHGPTGDKEPDAPAVVFWLELRRGGPEGATFVPHIIDDDSGVGTQVAAADLNRDGRPDVMVANKKGIFIHLSGL